MDAAPQHRGYAILGTPRCGSTHLCKLLTSTHVLGRPEEYLDRTRLRDWSPDCTRPHAHRSRAPDLFAGYPHPEHDIWGKIRSVASSDNGVYGIKAFYSQMKDGFAPQEIYENVLALPIVLLTRNDKLGQAISFARALQTWNWNSQIHNDDTTAKYNANDIDYCLNQILHHEASLHWIFAANGIKPLRLVYEEFIKQPECAVRRVGELVGIKDIDWQPQSPLKIQRDGVNAEWRQRYIEERSNHNSLPYLEVNDRWTRLGRKLMPILNTLPPLKRWMFAIG